MKASYATEREWLADFRREQQAASVSMETTPRAAASARILRKHITSTDLTRSPQIPLTKKEASTAVLATSGRRWFALRRHGR
jgi:hypothetical protein